MILGALLKEGWDWGAKFIAPIGLSFMAGQYIAGRNCEETQLRVEIATLKAEKKAAEDAAALAETLRSESVIRLAEESYAYRKAIADAKKTDPALAACLGRALPDGLRIDKDHQAIPAR